jgi:hypothetical protein
MADGIMVDIHLAVMMARVGRLRSLMRVHINRSAMLLPLAVAFIPLYFVPSYFDRNAPVNFVLLSIISLILAAFILRLNQINISKLVLVLVTALIVGTSISWLINTGKINMLTGDTGRYTGLISLFALILISLSYTQIQAKDFQWHLRWILVAVALVDLFGLIQYLEIYKLPTGAGFGSTLGNSDFFSAWLGTSLPLILAFKYHKAKIQIAFQLVFSVFTIFLMWSIYVKQGFIDLIILIGLLIIFKFKSIIKSLNWGPKFWTAVLSFFTIVWFELIFLLPMAKIKIPFFTDDVQVTIRSHFWNAGMQMFFDHIPFGVGPDNYGNYYEQYRSLDSFKLTEYVISNDAHSAVVQSFATLGLVNIFIFTALWIVLIKSLVTNIFKRPGYRNLYLVIGAYFLIFATNSMISPMTLPNKFIFWALAGFVIGSATTIESKMISFKTLNLSKAVAGILALAIAFVGINFSIAQLSFINSVKILSKDQKAVKYNFNPYLPCVIYFPAQRDLASLNEQNTPLDVAREQLKNNERCTAAQIFLAENAVANKDWKSAKVLVNNILLLAPARREVISLAAIYAVRADDKELQRKLVAQGEFLGLISATESVPQSQPSLK